MGRKSNLQKELEKQQAELERKKESQCIRQKKRYEKQKAAGFKKLSLWLDPGAFRLTKAFSILATKAPEQAEKLFLQLLEELKKG